MAFEGLLRAWSDERTLYRDATFAIVDKPAGVACSESATPSAGAPTPLLARLAQHGFPSCWVPLEVPKRASGATLVAFGEPPPGGARRASSPVMALGCVVAVDDWRLPASGSLMRAEPRGAAPIEYRVERRQGSRALVRLEVPAPGPEAVAVVLRALRERRQPVVGDEASSDAPAATRLMLHVSEVRANEVRGRVSGEAALPAEFESWLGGRAAPPPERFAEALVRAGISRHGLASEHDAFRLIGEDAGEIAGISVERYADHAVLYVSSAEAERRELEMAECLMDLGAAGVYVKRRVRADLRGVDPASLAPPRPLRGRPAPERLSLRQGPVRCWVSLGDGLATGVFLDQRANWERVCGWSRAAAWLNLFCYTGAFTLAAAAGGASATTSVDLAGRALSRLADNLELNGWSGPQHRLLKADVPVWLARAARASRRFDGIVLDPPSFGTRARGVLSTRRDNPELLQAALGLLAPGGRLLCVSHHRKISDRALREQVAGAGALAGLEVRVEPLLGGWDCPTLPGVSPTKSVLAQRT